MQMFLTKEELQALTGRQRRDAQVAALRQMGIEHKIRPNGPGRVHPAQPIQGFAFNPGEQFGEETALLYVERTKRMLIQYNHNSVRAGSIQQYLNLFHANPDHAHFLDVMIDPNAMRRLQQKQQFHRVELSIAVEKLTPSDRQRGLSVMAAIDATQDLGARNLEISFSMGHGRNAGMKKEKVDGLMNWVMHLLRRNPDALSKAKMSGKENIDGVSEVLDLLHQRLTFDAGELDISNDRRISLDLRCAALDRADRAY